MLFVCHFKILHKHCLKFLLGVKMAPRETENNAYAKFGVTNKEHYGILWYIWSGQLVDRCEDLHTPRLHFPFIFYFPRAKAMWSIFSNHRMEPVYLFRAFVHLQMADVMVSKRASSPDSFVYSKGKHTLLGIKTVKITWPFMQLIEVKEKVRISHEQARIQSSDSDACEEEVLAWKHDVSFNGLAIDYCILLYYNCKLRWACFLVFIFYFYSSIIYIYIYQVLCLDFQVSWWKYTTGHPSSGGYKYNLWLGVSHWKWGGAPWR